MERRRFLRNAGAGLVSVSTFAGCSGLGGDDERPSGTESGTDTTTGGTTTTSLGGTLRVATYSSFTGEGTAGNWLKSAFESEYPDATVEFTTPENGLNQYVQRANEGAPIDADLFVGLNTGELARADEQLDEPLFQTLREDVAGADRIKDGLQIDPQGRALPYDTGYISLVYDENEVEQPQTFDALLEPEYEGDLIVQNAQQSDPGRAFLLWTILAKDVDGYLDYWEGLQDNDVRIMSDWEPSYEAYTNGEAPMIVSYSTDQVYAKDQDVDMARHQVGFLDDQGYANPEAMAMFSTASNADLGRRFVEFALTEEAQREIAERNVQFPAVEGVEMGEEFTEYAYEPPEPVTFTYEELAGNVSTWIEDWARQVASK